MIELKNRTTLYDNLEEYTDVIDEEELKRILFLLLDIKEFKNSMHKNLTDENFYLKIFLKLQNEFNITKFKVIYKSNDQRVVLYKSQRRLKYNFSIDYLISEGVYINILFDNENLTKFQKIIINTYFIELIDLFYIQFVLSDLEKSVMIDPLTKLQNRISFNAEMKTLVPLAKREQMKFGVLLINIDRFRAVNDEHGDEFGDEFLKLYASIIKEMIRTSDIAVRFSGGEFLVLLINVESEEMTVKIAQKIQKKLKETYLLSPNNDKFQKTVSIGVSMFPEDSSDLNEVIKFTEMALIDSHSKGNGRNQLLRYKDITIGSIEIF